MSLFPAFPPEFLSGPWLLVAPIYTDADERDGIYLPGPATELAAVTSWFDYFDGTYREGGSTLDGYPAPLWKLPLFVRGGAIVPTWPSRNHFDAAPNDEIVLEIWPDGISSFELYEDDGTSRAALRETLPAFAVTTFHLDSPEGRS